MMHCRGGVLLVRISLMPLLQSFDRAMKDRGMPYLIPNFDLAGSAVPVGQ